LSVVLLFGILSTSNAEPQYKLEAKNFILNSMTQWQFDIYLSRTGGGTEPYVKGQFVITYNSAILPGGGTLSTTYVAGSSGLPAANQSTNCLSYAGGAQLYCIYITAPLDNAGTTIPDAPAEVRVGTYRVNYTLPYTGAPINAAWRFVTPPSAITKMWFNNGALKASVQMSNSSINFVVTGGEMLTPVELSSFTANTSGREVNLSWETKTETNSSMFQVERTAQSTQNWVSVGEVAASGNSNSTKEYSYTDKKLNSGKYVYRLKMVNNDGTFQYSKEVESEVALPKEYAISQNYPNPFNPTTRIDYQLPFDSKVTLELYGITGERVATILNGELSAGYYTADVNASALNLASGVYIYRMNASNPAGQNFVQVKKLMLTK
jgi:hypothetical protein